MAEAMILLVLNSLVHVSLVETNEFVVSVGNVCVYVNLDLYYVLRIQRC